MPKRIVNPRYYALNEAKNDTLKLTESEIKELIATYKAKINELKNK